MQCSILITIFTYFGLIFGLCKCDYDSMENNTLSLYCKDEYNPQNDLSMGDIMGMWYGSEIITHQDDRNNITGTFYFETCVVIHLADVTEQMTTTTTNPHRTYHSYARTPDPNLQTKYLRLIWDEIGVSVEYILRYNNSRRGFWVASAPQTGTMLDLNIPYRQFFGTIQVMKAVGDHLVLTFCKNMPESQQYSIVLSRKPNSLSHEDLASIRDLLRRRKLYTRAIRKICTSAGTITKPLSSFFMISVILLGMKKL